MWNPGIWLGRIREVRHSGPVSVRLYAMGETIK